MIRQSKYGNFLRRVPKSKLCNWCKADMTPFMEEGLLNTRTRSCSEKCRILWRKHYHSHWQRNKKGRIRQNVKKWRHKEKVEKAEKLFRDNINFQ